MALEKVTAKGVMKKTREVLYQPLYDTVLIVSGTGTQYSFFTTKRNTRWLSNMNNPGQMSQYNEFDIQGIGFKLLNPLETMANLHDLYHTSQPQVTLKVESKDKLELPMDHIPQGNGFVSHVTASAETNNSGRELSGNIFWLKKKIELLTLQSFEVLLQFASAPTLTADTYMRCTLYGIMRRPAQ